MFYLFLVQYPEFWKNILSDKQILRSWNEDKQQVERIEQKFWGRSNSFLSLKESHSLMLVPTYLSICNHPSFCQCYQFLLNNSIKNEWLCSKILSTSLLAINLVLCCLNTNKIYYTVKYT